MKAAKAAAPSEHVSGKCFQTDSLVIPQTLLGEMTLQRKYRASMLVVPPGSTTHMAGLVLWSLVFSCLTGIFRALLSYIYIWKIYTYIKSFFLPEMHSACSMTLQNRLFLPLVVTAEGVQPLSLPHLAELWRCLPGL